MNFHSRCSSFNLQAAAKLKEELHGDYEKVNKARALKRGETGG